MLLLRPRSARRLSPDLSDFSWRRLFMRSSRASRAVRKNTWAEHCGATNSPLVRPREGGGPWGPAVLGRGVRKHQKALSIALDS